MDLSLTGKRALVCGSSQGIGKAVAIELAALGAEVTLFARDQARLASIAGGLPAKHGQKHGWLIADFAQPEAVRAAAQAWLKDLGPRAGWHILVNNTGGPSPGALTEATPEQFLTAFSMQLLSAHHLVQACLPGMKQARYGRVINIISTSVKQPIPGLGVSNTVRGAVAQWAKTLAGELAPHGITVNNVLPGYTETERLHALVRNKASKAGATESAVTTDLVAAIPAGRFGKPEEIGAAVAFLASPSAAYINGINLPVDGGRLGGL